MRLFFPKDLADHARAVKTAHDAALGVARELTGDGAYNEAILSAYDRGFYAALLALQAAGGNVPLLSSGCTPEQLAKGLKMLGAGQASPLHAMVADFVEMESG